MRAITAIVAFLSTTAALAGCIEPGALDPAGATGSAVGSLPRFDLNLTIVERLTLTMEDGVTLEMAAFRPDVAAAGAADEKVPVLADIGPYYGNLAGTVGELTGFDERLAEYFVPRGYAVVRASVRGTGTSGGCFDLGGEVEQRDVAAIVDFLGAQPWSNGNVAVIGKSYDGTTPWMAALEKPAALKTIVPISGISDMYRYMFYDGAAYFHGPIFNTYYPLLVDHDVDPFTPHYYGADHAESNLVRTCADMAPQMAEGIETLATGDHDAFWDERDYESRFGEIEVPVFLVHGLQDWNVKPDNGVPAYDRITSPKMMWLGQWEHDYPDVNRFEPAWSRHDWNQTLLTWFDHWLKGVDNDWESLAHVEVQDQLGAWRTYETWPPVDAEELTLHLVEGGALTATPGAAATATYADPAGDGYDPATGERGVAFATDVLATDVTVLGKPVVDLHLAIDRPGGNVVVVLYDVDENGTWTEVDRGYKELRHRDSRDAGTPVPVGERFATTVEMYPQELTFAAGHRIGVAVAAEHPRWITASPFVGGTTTLHMGADAPSALRVLVSAGGADALAAAAGGAPAAASRGGLCGVGANALPSC